MDIFNIILKPFLFLIQEIFFFCYSITGNYGLSIVMLSLGISVLLLPVFIFIEKAKRKNDAIKLQMKPLADEIKRCYKGQERFYYLRTLNRQHNHSPLKSLITVISLLIQIPFFIAAYKFLENSNQIIGVGFLFIKDLSEPDEFFQVFNLLPIIMTLVNLLTAFFYTRHSQNSERKHMVLVAILFFILLFNLSSALVLYWTMNNVFGFVRLLITNPEVFKSKNKSRFSLKQFISKIRANWIKVLLVFFSISILVLSLQAYFIYKNEFEDFTILILVSMAIGLLMTLLSAYLYIVLDIRFPKISKITVKPVVFNVLTFFSIYYYIACKFYHFGCLNSLKYLCLGCLIVAQVLGFVYFIRLKKRINKKAFILISSMLFATSFIQILSLLYIIDATIKLFVISNRNYSIIYESLETFVLSGIVFLLVVIAIQIYFQSKKNRVIVKGQYLNSIYFLSSFYFFGFVFLWHPMLVYSSSPDVFSFSVFFLIKRNSILLVTCLFISIAAFFFVNKKHRWTLAVISLFLMIVSFVYSILIPIDMGSLQDNIYTKEQSLGVPSILFILESFGLVFLFLGITWLLKIERRNKQVMFFVVLLNIVTISSSFLEVFETGRLVKKDNSQVKNSPSITFSKTNRNVVYIIADMLQGWSMNRIINENSDLKRELNGFVWYPNTLAVSNITSTSISSLLGGVQYRPDKLNEDADNTIVKKVSDINIQLARKVKKNGFLFSTTKIAYSSIGEEHYDRFIPEWHSRWNQYSKMLNIKTFLGNEYELLWKNATFYSAPLFLKPIIYNNGQWFNVINNDKAEGFYSNRSKEYNFIRLLPHISLINDREGNFNLIYTFATHGPWNITNDDGSIKHNASPYENNLWFIKTIIKWFKWMKENGVFDNTRIVIVSDHGVPWNLYKGEIDIDIPFKNMREEIPFKDLFLLNAFLLVKDYDSNKDFSEDWRFMTNMDAPNIALEGMNYIKNIQSHKRVLHAFKSNWKPKTGRKKQFDIKKKYIVKDNIFDVNNWTRVLDR